MAFKISTASFSSLTIERLDSIVHDGVDLCSLSVCASLAWGGEVARAKTRFNISSSLMQKHAYFLSTGLVSLLQPFHISILQVWRLTLWTSGSRVPMSLSFQTMCPFLSPRKASCKCKSRLSVWTFSTRSWYIRKSSILFNLILDWLTDWFAASCRFKVGTRSSRRSPSSPAASSAVSCSRAPSPTISPVTEFSVLDIRSQKWLPSMQTKFCLFPRTFRSKTLRGMW